MKYDVILFDADDTLFDFTQCEAHALTNAFSNQGLELQAEHVTSYRKINQQLWNEYEQGQVNLDQLRTLRFERFIEEHNLSSINPSLFGEQYLQLLSEGSFLVEGAAELCHELAASGYRLAIITNGIKQVQLSRIGRSEIGTLFEQIIVSEETGFQKPQQEIFDYAFDKLNLTDRVRTIMVGDSLSSDIQGGNNYGIDTCWFNPHGTEQVSGIKPTYEILELAQLKAIVGID
ncbi:YjjG family noncanonical pyrimidine nucleotidase [Paenibacillus sp. N1-5-1-14]|uniref:YjjG family noncanonical pyrimidine nucleotidase n=1 Tax=Paenibacillus radicibacter TaxID=2972488 RepID=UPI00215951F0|nr:YjjG family noncanonical pyrimidine nucleotidase [Paenibacillus radicibacter]MCR8644455.1 YjjG family noncanonical pyrimidine nucleotidase [Paenibacillus radicibacter]